MKSSYAKIVNIFFYQKFVHLFDKYQIYNVTLLILAHKIEVATVIYEKSHIPYTNSWER